MTDATGWTEVWIDSGAEGDAPMPIDPWRNPYTPNEETS